MATVVQRGKKILFGLEQYNELRKLLPADYVLRCELGHVMKWYHANSASEGIIEDCPDRWKLCPRVIGYHDRYNFDIPVEIMK